MWKYIWNTRACLKNHSCHLYVCKTHRSPTTHSFCSCVDDTNSKHNLLYFTLLYLSKVWFSSISEASAFKPSGFSKVKAAMDFNFLLAFIFAKGKMMIPIIIPRTTKVGKWDKSHTRKSTRLLLTLSRFRINPFWIRAPTESGTVGVNTPTSWM